MAKYTEKNIIFNNVPTGGVKFTTGPALRNGAYTINDNNEITLISAKMINAVDINWNNALVDENTTLSSTADVLNWVKSVSTPEEVDLSNYYNKTEVNNLLNGVAYSSNTYSKSDVDLKFANLMGDNVPAALDTLKEIATELDNQGSVTSALVTNLANKANSSDVYTKTETESKISTAIQNAQIGGNVTIDSSLSSTSTNPVQNKAIYNALNGKVSTGSLSTVATSGKYSDLTGTPTIPSKTSDLTNDSGFLTTSSVYTKAEVNTAINNKKASVTNANATLAPGTNNLTIGSIDGTAITVNVPAGSGGSADLSNLNLSYSAGAIKLRNGSTVLTTTNINTVNDEDSGLMSVQDYCLLINRGWASSQETVYNSANITILIGQEVSSNYPYTCAVTYYSKGNNDTPNPTVINFNYVKENKIPLSGVVYYFEVLPLNFVYPSIKGYQSNRDDVSKFCVITKPIPSDFDQSSSTFGTAKALLKIELKPIRKNNQLGYLAILEVFNYTDNNFTEFRT